jgi:hypothetical protein
MPSFIALIVSLVLFRLLPHPANLAPAGALALMGGMYLGKRWALALPFIALFISDSLLNVQMGSPLFDWGRLVDYGAFLMIGMAGLVLRNAGRSGKLSAALATPFFFFLVSNLGVWLFGLGIGGVPYAKTLTGLATCFTAALPFLSGTVLGDWGFMALFAAVLMLARIPFRSVSRSAAL